MQRLLTSNIIPADHPINGLPKKLKIKYLRGLGEALCGIETNSQMVYKAKLCYDTLCEYLIGEKLEDGWSQSRNNKHIKAAQSLFRCGLRFFRMSDCFWWDVYRIAYQSGLPISYDDYNNVLKKTTGIFTNKYRKSAKEHFFSNGEGESLPPSLVFQSRVELAFHQRLPQKILIVGTMSAGKSTVVNALVGRKIAKVKATVCTTTISNLYNNPFIETVLYSDGISFINSNDNEIALEDIPNKALKFFGGLESHPFVITDTPGVDYAYDSSHRKIAYDVINRGDYDLLICVNNGPYIERNGEDELISYVLKQKNRKILFIFNQLDRFDPVDDSIEESLSQFKNLLKSKKSNAKVIPFSAKAAFLLKKELDGNLSKFEEVELKALKEKLSSQFYDFGMYGTGVCSSEDDYFARSGLTNLETTILNK